MLKHASITIQRINQFTQRFQKLVRKERFPLNVEIAGPVGRISHTEAQTLDFQPLQGNKFLEPLWATFWFRLRGEIPETWRDKKIDLLFHCRSEALLWIDGKPIQGLNYEGVFPGEGACRIDARLPEGLVQSGSIFMEVEAACNVLKGASGDNRYLFSGAELALFDQDAWDTYFDLFIPSQYLNRLLRINKLGMPWLGYHVPGHLSAWDGYLLERMNDICNVGDPDDRSTWPAVRSIITEIYSHKNATYAHEISALGHCHIDTAWLWPLAETKRKCARSFSTALSYMKRYPEYKFACSQAQQYQWMKDDYPAIYAEIKEAIKRGQWIPVGGTWIEPDCNIPSGESLVRQFLHGKRFFREEFNWDCKEFWNPDVFGYSGALPQIIRGAGIEFFLTQKLFWNQINKPQYQNFLWRGIDGSEVLTHFPPAESYSAMTYEKLFSDLLSHEAGMVDHDRLNEGLLLYGLGDGGGGPTTQMLEVLRRVADFQGVPRTEQRDSQTFFHRLKKRLRSVPVIEGELYLELHRATYTTQAANKLGNRRGETLLRNAEMLSSVAGALRPFIYPAADLDRLWKLLLLNQFHDILPGSSIHEVHEQSRNDYRHIEDEAGKIIKQSAHQIVENIPNKISIINTCGWTRRGLLEIPQLPGINCQKSWSGTYLTHVSAPTCGTANLEEAPLPFTPCTITETNSGFSLENNYLQAQFLKDGQLTSLIEKSTRRETVADGQTANRLVLFEDRPLSNDAWDVEIYHLEKPLSYPSANQVRVIEQGPIRSGLEFSYSFGDSTLIQRVFLSAESRQLDFDCEVNWHHRKQFLKVEFPVLVHAPEATYEIQFGHVKRPTHFSTSHDMARFEVCAHRWIDLGEPGFGVSLMTDCKYGYSVHDNVMRISLLRGAEYPDPTADIGHHHFSYAIYPHVGSFVEAEVVRRAYEFNTPWITTAGSTTSQSWLTVDSPHLIIDTVKKAEGSDNLIVRLYECHGTHGTGFLLTTLPFSRAVSTNLLEETESALAIQDGKIPLSYKPFQILTVMLIQ